MQAAERLYLSGYLVRMQTASTKLLFCHVKSNPAVSSCILPVSRIRVRSRPHIPSPLIFGERFSSSRVTAGGAATSVVYCRKVSLSREEELIWVTILLLLLAARLDHRSYREICKECMSLL
jgi:hypothetical protein